MAGTNVNASDVMIRRLEEELREKETIANGIIERANASNRDLSTDERKMMAELRGRIQEIHDQIVDVEDVNRVAFQADDRAKTVDAAIKEMRGVRLTQGEIEYRSCGQYINDMYDAAMGSRDAKDRLEMYNRTAAHQKTGTLTGVIPDPIVGPVVNFIDAARPVVSALGPRALNNQTFYRPKVTVHTAIGAQGTTGAADKEKNELTSQAMTITRLTVSAKTFGGYVNVSRQSLDFSEPAILDTVITDLAAQYAIETEAEVGDVLGGVDTAAVSYGTGTDADDVAAGIWDAAAAVYTAVKGQGRLIIVVAPDVLSTFGPLFAPYGQMNQQGTGFMANNFAQGVMGSISGIQTVMSAGIGAGEAYLLSTAALEVYEQRVGALQVVEPSVLGLQVAYAGYFSTCVINDDGVVPLVVGS